MKRIPVHQLQDKTSTGLQIKVFRAHDKWQNEAQVSDAHRDDHYIFFLLTNGQGTLKVDLQDIVLTAGQLYYILPSQVHYHIKTSNAEGWFLAVDTSLIPPDFRDVFERQLNLQTPCSLTHYELKQYSRVLGLLCEEFVERQNNEYYLPIIHTLTQSFLAMAASTYNTAQQSTENKRTRPSELIRQFKNLLAAHSHTIRSPSDYASKLNVSLGYLNESIKKATGSPVSYWIQQEILSEAKRLLYHSDFDVKQIACELGYTDYAYFSRFFRKASGMPPSEFRTSSRKQSSK
jgi:AraC family transcriptional activator of pobA